MNIYHPKTKLQVVAMVVIFMVAILACVGLYYGSGWLYTSHQLALAREEGVYAHPEQGMIAFIEKHYNGIHRIDIQGAGPNEPFGIRPYVWYVVAEVHADSFSDGSALPKNGCDAPGTFFLQTKDGWVEIGEGRFPGIMASWMEVYGWAGLGETEPSTSPVRGRHCEW